MCKSDSVAKEV